MNKSLTELITDRERQQQRRRRPDAGSNGRIRNNGSRGDRRSDPYDARDTNRAAPTRVREKTTDTSYDCALKFLLSNHFAGSVIGNGGFAMKDLIEITDANIHIANPGTPFPGSNERVLFIAGSEASLFLASALIWEMIGQQTHSYNNGMALVWNPAAAKASPGEYDTQEVECRIAVPAACGGRILGRGGAVFRKMSSDHQVETKMSPVQDADILQERVISIKGTVSGCMAFTADLLSKMLEAPEECKYVHSGSAYPRELVNATLSNLGLPARDRDTSVGRRRGDGRSDGRRNDLDDDSVGTGRNNYRNESNRGKPSTFHAQVATYMLTYSRFPVCLLLEQVDLRSRVVAACPPGAGCLVVACLRTAC